MNNTTEPRKRSREETILLNRLGRSWLKAFFAAIRTAQFHEPTNQIFNEPISHMIQHGDEIIQKDGFAEFMGVDDQFYLNRLWIKPTITERNTLYALADLLKTHGLGGVTIRSNTTILHWQVFLKIFSGIKSESTTRASEMNRLLAEANIEELEVHPVLHLEQKAPEDLPFSPQAYAAVVGYAKCLLSLKEFIASAPGEEQVLALRKAQRVICELVDFSEKYPRLFGVLSLLKDFDSYFVHHSVNVMVLSLLFGRYIGMGRKELVDLGMAGLFFDAGKIAIPDTILTKTEPLTPSERELIERHPIESASIFLTLGYLNESVAERVLVAYQHHWATRSPDAYPKPRRPMEPSAMSEIVGICDRYDALATDKSYRKGLSPRNALRVMAAESDRGLYRRELLDAFLGFMGPMPLGTLVEVDDQEVGMVVAGGSFSTQSPFPLIFIPPPAEGLIGTWLDPSKENGFKSRRLKPLDSASENLRATLGALFGIKEDSLILESPPA